MEKMARTNYNLKQFDTARKYLLQWVDYKPWHLGQSEFYDFDAESMQSTDDALYAAVAELYSQLKKNWLKKLLNVGICEKMAKAVLRSCISVQCYDPWNVYWATDTEPYGENFLVANTYYPSWRSVFEEA